MRLVAARLAEIRSIQFLDDGVLMRFSQRKIAVLFIERRCAQALEVPFYGGPLVISFAARLLPNIAEKKS